MAKENPNYVKGRAGSFKYCDKSISGVYIIINDNTKEFYIGSSNCINTRLSHHFGDLRRGVSVCDRLQQSYNKSNYEDFSFFVLYQTSDLNIMRDKEVELLEDNYDNPLLLNTSTLNNNWSNERNKDKVVGYKKKLSDIAKQRTGEKNPFYGKSHSEEMKKKLAEIHKGRIPANARKVSIEDIVYESVSEAARQLNVTKGTIIHRIKSKNNLYVNYHYVS